MKQDKLQDKLSGINWDEYIKPGSRKVYIVVKAAVRRKNTVTFYN